MRAAHSKQLLMRRLSCRVCAALVLSLFIAGCASWQAPDEFDESALRARAETAMVADVRLSASVLSAEDSQQMFGANVNETGIQPVWVEVENNTNQVLWLLRTGTDPDLFSPLEVAWSFHASFASETNARLDDHFADLSFQNPVSPGETQSGILFTNPHHNTRLLSVDVLGQGQVFPFTLFPQVPDDITVESSVMADVKTRIAAAAVDYQQADDFRNRLEQLSCCANSIDETQLGDPINVVLVGSFADVSTALVRRGFRMNVLPLDNDQHLFGRPPCVVVRKTSQGGGLANWLRIWVAPFSYQGKAVFLTQAGRRQGWRMEEIAAEDFKLNPNVDEVRDLLIQDLLYSNGLEKVAFVTGVEATMPGESRSSLGGASYHTDGLRAVLFMATRPLSLSDLEILNWHPYLELIEKDKVKEIENAGD